MAVWGGPTKRGGEATSKFREACSATGGIFTFLIGPPFLQLYIVHINILLFLFGLQLDYNLAGVWNEGAKKRSKSREACPEKGGIFCPLDSTPLSTIVNW